MQGASSENSPAKETALDDGSPRPSSANMDHYMHLEGREEAFKGNWQGGAQITVLLSQSIPLSHSEDYSANIPQYKRKRSLLLFLQ